MSETQTLDKVRALVMPIVGDLQLDLYDLEFRGGTLRVTVDTPVGSTAGVDLDTIALATRLIGREFDHHDPVPGHYTLEVTSPGLERTLRTPAHFQRELGKVVALRLRDTTNADRRVQGVLTAADEHSATITPEDGAEPRTVKYDQIDRARTVFTWGPSPKPGKGPKNATTANKAAREAPATSRTRREEKAERTSSDTASPAETKEQAR